MKYVDGYVVPVPKRNIEAYRKIARKCGKIWCEHGALEYKEYVAEDVAKGKRTSFPRSVKAKPNETIVFAYVIYKSRAHRDRVNKKAMNDPRLKIFADPKTKMPFDPTRMFWGGFKILVSA